MLNTSLIVNKDFINGYDVTVDEEDGYYSILDKSGETVHKIRESMLNTSLIVNKDFINGYDVTVDEEDGYYSILDKDKNTVLGNVSRVEFTMSNLIIVY